MIIASSTVALQSQRLYSLSQQSQVSVRNSSGPTPAAASAVPAASGVATSSSTQAAGDGSSASDPYLTLLELLIEMLTGRPARVFDASRLHANSPQGQPLASTVTALPAPASPAAQVEVHSVRQESEQTTFTAQGTVKTADGREIDFQLGLTMSRQFSERVDIVSRTGDAQLKDPLVINFGGNAAQLQDSRFGFDINADGKAESVPLLAGGSGYLALDLNGNGKIDSGAELLGPTSGSGFADLAQYDQDGNGWIDSNDPVFGKLKAWTPDQDGAGTLTSLASLGVGALYLGNAATPFALRGAGNASLGAVSGSGLYLTEDGRAGSLQEVDLTV